MTTTTTPPPTTGEPQSSVSGDLVGDNDIHRAELEEPPLPARPRVDVYENPQIASLHAVFPDFDTIVLQSVLDSVHGDQERAVDKLLGMSDPEYEERRAPDQTELDEQFARQLLLEDQERHRWATFAQPQGPYQPQGQQSEVQGSPNQSGGRSPGGNGPNFQEVSVTFNKIAESGKKTFSSLFTKVKAKMQEFDQSRNDPNAVASGSQYPANAPNQDRHTLMQQQSYYDPNYRPYEPRAPAVQGYDMSPAQPTPQLPENVRASNAFVESPRQPSDIQSPSSPKPSNIDPSKLGLLPKRPVSLINSSPPPKILAESEDRQVTDELEYAENPFEDDRRK